MGGDGRHFEDVGEHELGVAVLGVFFQQLVQDGPGLGAVAVEEVLASRAQAVGPLPAGAQRGVEGHVAEQVEGVGLGLAGGFGQLLEVDAPLGQGLDDRGALLRVGPLGAQLRRALGQRVRTFSAV